MAYEVIDKDTPLSPGDRVEMVFDAIGKATWEYSRAIQLYALESRLKQKNPYWKMISWSNLEDVIIVRFEITEPPEDPQTAEVAKAGIITGTIIAATVIGAGLFAWLSFREIRLITKTPTGKIALAGAGVGGLAAVILPIVIIYTLIRKK